MPTDSHAVFLCYRLVSAVSGSQPFILEPADSLTPDDPNQIVVCSKPSKPLMMDDHIVVAIQAESEKIRQIKVLNVSATDAAGNPINPAPVRPSFSGTASGAAQLGARPIYFLSWPNPLPGDVIRTISINAVFQPAPTAGPWLPNTLYPAGSVVTTPQRPGQYFQTTLGGISGRSSPSWPAPLPVLDNTVEWQYIGTIPPNGANAATTWQSNTNYPAGALVHPTNQPAIYIARASDIASPKSGQSEPQWPPALPTSVKDMAPMWQFIGYVLPPGVKSSLWLPSHSYTQGDVVQPSYTADRKKPPYFLAKRTALSGTIEPDWPAILPTLVSGPDLMQWQPIGKVLPTGASAAAWTASTAYKAGALVTPIVATGEYYIAAADGNSAQTNAGEPGWLPASALPVPDGALMWQLVGDATPAGAQPAAWSAGQQYHQGDLVKATSATQYFVAETGGFAGLTEPFWPYVSPPPIHDGAIWWKFYGMSVPTGWNIPLWVPNQTYKVGALAQSPLNLNYYVVVAADAGASGNSGSYLPNFPDCPPPSIADGSITWMPVGTGPPGVTPAQSSDQNVNLLNFQLQQSHTRFTYNLTAGIIYSTVRKPSYAVPAGVTAMMPGTSANEVLLSNNPTLDGALLLTIYPVSLDSETSCIPFLCLFHDVPGISAGISLSAPTSSFYFGISADIVRNAQLVIGDNLALVQSPPTPPVTITTTATTSQKFTNGLFVGLTFNVSGFVQGLITNASASGH